MQGLLRPEETLKMVSLLSMPGDQLEHADVRKALKLPADSPAIDVEEEGDNLLSSAKWLITEHYPELLAFVAW